MFVFVNSVLGMQVIWPAQHDLLSVILLSSEDAGLGGNYVYAYPFNVFRGFCERASVFFQSLQIVCLLKTCKVVRITTTQ